MTERYDVVIAGAGNAALSAAHAARELVERILVLEKAPREWAGGNSYFTAGAFRTTFAGLDELRPILDGLSDELAAETDLPAYTPEDFAADLTQVTQGRCDPELTTILVREAAGTIRWLHEKGTRFRLMYERQAYRVNDGWRFWGGLAVGTVDGGRGLIDTHIRAAVASGVELRYGCTVVDLQRDERGSVTGVVCTGPSGSETIAARAVVVACGGFEADPRLRAVYLGPSWDLAKVRGTPYNTGEGLHMCLEAGAQPYGHWSGCHAIAWDAGAPLSGDRELTNRFSRQSYPLGIVVNAEARRFLDEGADFRNYTYAKYGAEILRQPGAVAFQLFDAKTAPLLPKNDYAAPGATHVEAPTIGELARGLGLRPDALTRTVNEFNAAVQEGGFNPAIKDRKSTTGIQPPKSNWAQPLDSPPYQAFPVTCGITFTFGGVRIDSEARVLDRSSRPIRGLYAAGELVGGVFYHNYPGGTGLTAGAVFGRRAGESAADFARSELLASRRSGEIP
jgi:tricarballylate dehydrogenase